MTEEGWSASTDPTQMLNALICYPPPGPLFGWLGLRSSWVDPRNARLFMAACCRWFLPLEAARVGLLRRGGLECPNSLSAIASEGQPLSH